MTEPKEMTMATIQGTRDNPIEGRLASTPKPKIRKPLVLSSKGKTRTKTKTKRKR
jgi:hypothetical protein